MVTQINGYSDSDKAKISKIITTLLKHVPTEQIILAGGLAIRTHLANSGQKREDTPFNDLDILLNDMSALRPSVTDDFQIYHYHVMPPTDRDKFYIVLVDPNTHTKIDIFDAEPLTAYPVSVKIDELELAMRSAEDQLVTKVIECSRVLKDENCERMWIDDVKLLFEVVDLKIASKYWEANVNKDFFSKQPELKLSSSLKDAWDKIQSKVQNKPELLKDHVHRRPEPYDCEYCTVLDAFPVTPMQEIYKTLGYVE